MIAALRLTTGHPLPDATVIALVDPADRARLEELRKGALLVYALPGWKIGEEVGWLTWHALREWRA